MGKLYRRILIDGSEEVSKEQCPHLRNFGTQLIHFWQFPRPFFVFLLSSGVWGWLTIGQQHPEVTNADYIPPEEYAKILLESAFAPCPRGRALDTFRIYEALEAGAIPIIELANGYARDHLPPDYMDSPMIFIESWSEVPEKMASLFSDPSAINAKQKAVQAWYDTTMRTTVKKLEDLLESRRPLA